MNEKSRRTFLALPLSKTFSSEVAAFFKSLDPRANFVKWVKPEHAHITLHFFGPTSDSEFETIQSLVGPVARVCSPLTMALEGVGFFPSAKNPRVVWTGMAGDSEILCGLQSQIENKLKAAGFACEERNFQPHLTLGRIKDRVTGTNFSILEQLSFPRTETRTIDHLVLYESQLSSSGPYYEIIDTFPLAGKKAA